MSINITLVKVVRSEFDSERHMFRRKLIGADGFGYSFVRPIEIDRENSLTEHAIASDLLNWMNSAQARDCSVTSFAPKYDPLRPVTWLPDVRIVRPTRHYWHPDRLQVHSRIKAVDKTTYNLFTPLCLVGELLSALAGPETDLRAHAHDAHKHAQAPDFWPTANDNRLH